MKLGLLTQYPDNGSSRRLVEEAELAGHSMRAIDYLRCHITMSADEVDVYLDDAPLPVFDAVIPRVSASATYHGTSIVRHFEMQGVYVPNQAQAISRSRDKLRSLQLMARKGIHMPRTAFGHPSGNATALLDAVGGAPVIVKIIEGTQGIGVVRSDNRTSALSAIEAFWSLGAQILIQEYVAEAAGEDLRCFVVGKKVIASMVRRAAPGEFRANLHRGGSAASIKLTPAERALAVTAARAMNLGIAGVDLIRSKDGPLVIEVNSSPGLGGIEAATGVNVAKAVIEHTVTQATKTRRRGEDRVEG
ncbi:MAG: RimK family alpha-L-glutamate ligase [Polyangiales bacterium]